MAGPTDTTWHIEPHTLAKHEILRRYLAAWFPILASGHQRIVYLDGFCGPGRYAAGEPGSPIIALEEAKKHSAQLGDKQLTFLFLDEDNSRLIYLKEQLDQIALPENFKVFVQQGEFEDELRRLLERLDKSNRQMAPTFAFIDPFGFKDVPFEIVSRLLRNRSCEVLINFHIDKVNRFLEHPQEKIRQHIADWLGITDVQFLAHLPGDRIGNLRMLYQKQLKTVARFVRFFEMRNDKNRPIYDLFFASNHPLGHIKMKEAFWRVDQESGYRFSDATNPDQLLLFENDPAPELARLLQMQFGGEAIYSSEIKKWVNDETPFIGKHTTGALKYLESRGDISVEPIRRDGTKRRKNQYPGNALVRFK
ncbi:MAG: three-Cys-motif partner protein TcmP [Caldilineaceae bacterium]|nr:three-Cys-motif partner protein TcmP [Caldilineaceae bacterium]